MNLKNLKIKFFQNYYRTKIILFNILIKLILNIIPSINRENLIKIGKKRKSIIIVENEYEFLIKEPSQSLAKKRFKKSCGIRKVDCFFGVKIDNVRLIGPYGIPFTKSGKIIIEPISKSWLFHVFRMTIIHIGFFGFLKQYILAIFPKLESKEKFLKIGGYLLCRGSKSNISEKKLPEPIFGHWLGEQLPQIRGIEGISQKINKKFPLIINKSPKDWQIESLEIMGYNRNDIFEYNQVGLRVGEIIIASLRNTHSRETEFDPKARKWAAKRLQSKLVNLNLSNHDKKNIFLFRQNEKTRRISNYKMVKNTLLELNYDEVSIENLNLQESSLNFYLAENFVSIYGSGIMRIMFMKNPKKLIEIFSLKKNDRDTFFLIANEFGMKYECIAAEIVSSKKYNSKIQHKNMKNNIEENDWHVPIGELKKYLA